MEILGIQSPTHLFSEIDTALSEFQTPKGTTFRNLFFLLSALNHLREWIAPGYKSRKAPAKMPNEIFFNSVFDNCAEWKLINSLCNGLKHIDPITPTQTSDNASSRLSDWHTMAGVTSLAHGHPQKFTVEGQDVIEILEAVRNYYATNWFEKQSFAVVK